MQSYANLDLVQHVQDIEDMVTNDHESKDNSNACSDNERVNTIDENNISPDNVVTIKEDLSQFMVVKLVTSTFQVYEKVTDDVTDTSILQEISKEKPCKKTYSLQGVSKKSGAKLKEKLRPSPFVTYKGTYIRKTTALYLLQENFQVSSDRLLHVHSEQPSHIFSGFDLNKCGPMQCVCEGDLCIFYQG